MKFLEIQQNNTECLSSFIDGIGVSSEHFRYYNNRDISAVKNHIVTFLLYDKQFVGYGHLDQEDGKTWLGICVKEGHYGKGYGKKIMKRLTDSYDGDICLSVDASNTRAIELYGLFYFIETHKNDKTIYMKRASLPHEEEWKHG
jgi:ribosomal protein S18 acetylase RimI-like enzyme|tara:strand:- start:1483 stop:1914 length:432 start_codon:yes stop_codon:yes gene_type:complete